jgi:hypothetical protein
MQGIEGNSDSILVTVVQSERAIQEEGVAFSQVRAASLEAPHADLRALQIAQQTDIATTRSRGLAEIPGAFAMFIGTTVRKIEARNIQTCFDHLAQCVRPL